MSLKESRIYTELTDENCPLQKQSPSFSQIKFDSFTWKYHNLCKRCRSICTLHNIEYESIEIKKSWRSSFINLLSERVIW